MIENEVVSITLTMDSDEELECVILNILQVNGKDYIALLPLDDNEEEEEVEVFLYRFIETEDGDPELLNIEDDDEYELVTDAFDEWMDAQDFDELDPED